MGQFLKKLAFFCIEKNKFKLGVIETAALMIELLSVHLKLNQIYLKELFYEKLFRKSTTNSGGSQQSLEGLLRSDLEVFIFEELGISEVNESHSILSRVMLEKLQTKKSSHATTKIIMNEQKVQYKYKDIEYIIVKEIA